MTQYAKPFRFFVYLLTGAFLFCGGSLAYVYLKDTGVDYGGRARLDYNWRYISAEKPAYEYRYEGKLFSFSYLTGLKNNFVRVFESESGGSLFGDMLKIFWYLEAPAEIRAELAAGLSSGPGNKWEPSQAFSQWLTGQPERYYAEKAEAVRLKDGTAAALIQVKPKSHDLGGVYRYLVAEKGGLVVKVLNLAASSATEDQYRQLRFGPGLEGDFPKKTIRPDGDRDHGSLIIFERLAGTLELLKK